MLVHFYNKSMNVNKCILFQIHFMLWQQKAYLPVGDGLSHLEFWQCNCDAEPSEGLEEEPCTLQKLLAVGALIAHLHRIQCWLHGHGKVLMQLLMSCNEYYTLKGYAQQSQLTLPTCAFPISQMRNYYMYTVRLSQQHKKETVN